jgi:hypothetical protein
MPENTDKPPEDRTAYFNAYHKRRYAEDPEWRARRKLATNKNRIALGLAERRRRGDVMLAKKFGVTLEEIQALENKCQICGSLTHGGGRDDILALCIDHDHETGQLRGKLCNNCNTALGKFKDSEELLLAAVSYLRRFKEKQ